VGQSAEQIIDQVMELGRGTRFMVLAPVVRGRKGEYGKLLDELRADGFARVKIDERCACWRSRSCSTSATSTTSRWSSTAW
jgi:excinuclease UvrABC ATPase subunit